VTRIIAGFAGSIPLAVPSSGTRPTSDRVREAIFSALESRDAVRGARVIDLYAGSGALGLEAASRGAASVDLVERSATAARVCRENGAAVARNAPKDAVPTITVVGQPVQTYLDRSAVPDGRSLWDLALVDPPYDLSADELVHALAALAPLMAPDATVLVERRSRDAEPTWPASLELERSRVHGDTVLYWLTPASA
jgi:16S rRNA (guanine966-N2)-methyltransferase